MAAASNLLLSDSHVNFEAAFLPNTGEASELVLAVLHGSYL
jgi:hypothetical protein